MTSEGIRLPGGTEFELAPDQWWALRDLADLIGSGGRVTKRDGMCLIELDQTTRFIAAEAELPSAACVFAERFVRHEYAHLNVANKVVVDIGANIGDSAVYFARRGAAHVYGYEPFRRSYETACRNVALNSCDGSVTLIWAGVSNCDQEVVAVYDASQSLMLLAAPDRTYTSPQLPRPEAEPVHLIRFARTLEDAAARHPQLDIVCKIDCEGCEYELFEDENLEGPLQQVSEIFLEFHSGKARHLAGRLTELGFATEILPQNGREDHVAGHLLASRRGGGSRTAT